jgi:hypothetical protein
LFESWYSSFWEVKEEDEKARRYGGKGGEVRLNKDAL